jgi:Uma2 family endonuclease
MESSLRCQRGKHSLVGGDGAKKLNYAIDTAGLPYEALNIPEYWIDYAGLGSIRHIGKPKQPTLTIATLADGEYETQMLRGDDRIISPTFPGLKLTAAKIM